MTRQAWPPGKQRTRGHVIADLSVNHIERFILEDGHTVERQTRDYGYDLTLQTFDAQGALEPGVAYLQLKAAESLRQARGQYFYDLDVRDYNLWMRELSAVFLVLYDAKRRLAFWAYVQAYFRRPDSPKPRKGAKTVRLSVQPQSASEPESDSPDEGPQKPGIEPRPRIDPP